MAVVVVHRPDHKLAAATAAVLVVQRPDHKLAAAREVAAVEEEVVEVVEVVVALSCHLQRPSAPFLHLPLLLPLWRSVCCCSELPETLGSRQRIVAPSTPTSWGSGRVALGPDCPA